ncbi:MAG: zinc-binding metallopeptidase family protein, partial [Mobilitalea sp.]
MTAFITDEERMFAQELLNFIDQSPSAFHAAHSVKKILVPQGFQELSLKDKWSLVPGGNYFVSRNNSALIAFTVGLGGLEDYGFHLIAAHTDSPSFRVKSLPEIQVEGRYLKLNVEAYGGPILNTWLDRPLSLAGRIVLRGETPFSPQIKLYNSERPLLVIPNQSIHLNRKINEGIELNKQKDMLPLLSQVSDDLQNDKRLVYHLAEIMNCPEEEILDFDLFLFETIKGSFVGLQQEYLSSGRLDDLAMVHAGAWALAKSEP